MEPNIINEIRSKRRDGYSLQWLSREYNVAVGTIRYHTKGILVNKTPHTLIQEKPIIVPIPSEDWAYFWGFYTGDGCLTQMTRSYSISISCDIKYEYLIANYSAILSDLFRREAKIYKTKRNCAIVRIHGVDLPNILQLPPGAKTEEYKVPEWIFSDRKYAVQFLKGLIETDGSCYRRDITQYGVMFTQKNKTIFDYYSTAMSLCDYSFTKSKGNAYQAQTSTKNGAKEMIDELRLHQKMRTYSRKNGAGTENRTPTP
jgi:hypothetical protein